MQRVPLRRVVRFAVREGLLALALVPLAALGVACYFVPYQAVRLVTRVVRVPLDQAATFKIAVSLAVYGLWIGVLAGVAWQWTGPRGALAAAVVLLALAPAALVAVERVTAAWDIVAGWLASQLTDDRVETGLVRRRAELADLLDGVRNWIGTNFKN
jgi:hypothetical protein